MRRGGELACLVQQSGDEQETPGSNRHGWSMVPFVAQVAYLTQIKEAFLRGSDHDKVVAVLIGFASIVVPLVLVLLAIRYRSWLAFHLRRMWQGMLHKQRREQVARFLHMRRLPLEVYILGRTSTQILCKADLSDYGNGWYRLGLLAPMPASRTRVILGKRIMIVTRPFKFKGQRYNSFQSYIRSIRGRGDEITDLVILTPDRFVHLPRRRFPRKRLARQGAVRFRIWGPAKKNSFTITKPDFESEVEGPKAMRKRIPKVINISQGGILILVYMRPPQGTFRVGEELVMELTVLNAVERRYDHFLLMGGVRSISHGLHGAQTVGIEFKYQGLRNLNRQLEWISLPQGLPELAGLLEAMQKRPAPAKQ